MNNRQMGVVIGLVESVEDPRGEGRVQISFPWMPGLSEYPWAPMTSPLAGSSRGLFFLPEPGDEVLVACEHGDFDHPFIVGFLWNGRDRPPETEAVNRVIVTPGGHTLRFEDEDGAKKIIIRSSGGLQITMDDSAGSIELQGGGRIIAMRNAQVQIS